ncbi:MAG: thiamine pyrophosphate-dependent enzyme [Burkholderiaceae bacterium]
MGCSGWRSPWSAAPWATPTWVPRACLGWARRRFRRPHMFQNMGDGTYFHSGLLAIRAAVAAGTNITFKILFNDAVAMTGGQRHDGPLDPGRISRQVHAEGVGGSRWSATTLSSMTPPFARGSRLA